MTFFETLIVYFIFYIVSVIFWTFVVCAVGFFAFLILGSIIKLIAFITDLIKNRKRGEKK